MPVRAPPLWVRILIGLAALSGLLAAWRLGAFEVLSPAGLQARQEALAALVASHYAAAFALFMLIYALATLAALPGVLWLIIAGGFLFGAGPAAAGVVAAGAIGAAGLFRLARGVLRAPLAARAGPFLQRVEAGFRQDQALFMLSLRLAPIVPYFVANIAPAVLGARFVDFLWTTIVGLIPSALAYAWIGARLAAAAEGAGDPMVWISQLWPAFAALAALPLLAIGLRRLAARRRG